MKLVELMDICEEYSALGGSVQEQLIKIGNNAETIAEQNGNALRRIISFLKMINRAADRNDDTELAEDSEELIKAIQEDLDIEV